MPNCRTTGRAPSLGVYINAALPTIHPFDLRMPPFFLERADDLRPAGPPVLGSARYARDLDEVRRLGAEDSPERSAAQTLLTPVLLDIDYPALLGRIARQPGRSLSQNARLFALAWMSAEDGWLAVMDAKMHYGLWRPITAIRNADRDGNNRTQRVENWLPLLRTPSHPEYPCGHCVMAAAMATILEAETGPEPAGGILITGFDSHASLSLTVPTWTAFVDAMSLSRIHAGAHYRFSNETAEAMGRDVARRALAGSMQVQAPDRAFVLPGDYSQATTLADLQAAFGSANVQITETREVVLFADDPTRRASVSFHDEEALQDLKSITVRDVGSHWRGKLGLAIGTPYAKLREANGKPFIIYRVDPDQPTGWVHDGWSPAIDGDEGRLGAFDVSEGEHMYFEVELGLPASSGPAPAVAWPDNIGPLSDEPGLSALMESLVVTGFAARTSLDDEW